MTFDEYWDRQVSCPRHNYWAKGAARAAWDRAHANARGIVRDHAPSIPQHVVDRLDKALARGCS